MSEAELARYNVLSNIGNGSFAHILKVVSAKTSIAYAAKLGMVKHGRVQLTRSNQDFIEAEAEILKNLSHPNIVKFQEFGWIADHRSNNFTLSPTGNNWNQGMHPILIMEYCPGKPLSQTVPKHASLPEAEAQQLLAQMFSAVAYLTSLGIVHRDIKKENIMDLGNGTYKLCDFGFASFGRQCKSYRRGTPYYMAPEIWAEWESSHPVDVWALGILTYMVLFGQAPFDGINVNAVEPKIRRVEYGFPASSEISTEAHDFIKLLLVFEAEVRLTAQEALRTPWLRDISPLA